MPPQLLSALNPLPGYAALDAALPERLFALFVVIGFVRVQFLGTLPRSAAGTSDGLYGVHEILEHHRIVDVCRCEHHSKRDAASVDHKVALRARFPLICRI